jgi:hypothetical protein
MSAIRSAALASLLTLIGTSVAAQGAKGPMRQDPACQSLTPVSAGGPAPKNAETVVVRWLGMMNYELAYRDQVFLLNAYFDRLPHSAFRSHRGRANDRQTPQRTHCGRAIR